MARVPLSDTLKREARLQRFMRELESGIVQRLPQDWDAVAAEHTSLVSTLQPIFDRAISAKDRASVCSCAGTLKDKDGEAMQKVESYHPASLFGFDLEQYCSDEASDRRMLAIQDLDDVEVLIIKAVSDEAELGHFRDPLRDLEISFAQLKSIEIELSEDMKRWEHSLRDLEGTHAADPQEDPALADYQQYEKAYLERKILATKTILDARQESADCIAQLLEDFDDLRARFKQSKRGIFNLLAAARQKRNALFDGENEGLQEALETYRACVEYMSVYVTSYLCRSLPDRAHAQVALAETMMTARVKIESIRVNAGALDRTINLQASHMEVVSGALLSFTDCIDARKRTVKEKMHKMDEDLNAARERWLQEIEDAEMELQTHRERYEKVHQAEEDARMLIDEERAAVEAYEEYQRQNRPRTKEEIAAELESEIQDLADMFDVSRRIRRFLIIVETCANKAQKTSFEARQIFIASQRAREIPGAVAAGDFDQLEDQCIRIGKRLRTGRFLLADLQSAFEFHYPELRHRLFTLKDEVKLEHGRRRSLRGSGESGALSDSDSDSEYSVPEEFADGRMNLDRAIHSCAQDVEYLADLCSEWAEVVGPEEAQRRRQQADPQDDSNTEAQVANHAPKSRLERIAKAPQEGLQRSYVLYVNRKQRFRNRVLAPALKRAGDPFGAKEARRHEAATTIQRHVRGFLCRKRLLIEAVIRVQLAYRKFKAYKKFKKALFASTAKYYDVISCRYYYVWAGGKVAWAPPEPIADWYIPYGKRTKRPLGYEWTKAEAATLIQSIVRARAERKRYVQRVMESFEKVYEPSRQACFYQNKFTGKCQWHKPLGLGLLDIPIANLDTEGFVER
ncbi:Hypothetical Protein FCC1311_087122 [Hondaea fermentalgiana]|uniref:WW domain-containing protein n=1 Tax=Hondaea fermentalgiana TaxID=2315210 RepID=A0A2R5GNM2_9STRA|nr:Hypothetical Protein FCC1311_087122 [Hondaea fermentalgiana]|eukprot:GBG32487.1 Hypothetical Protein FCC1311_087122 [Hondaea fermentalgiana]